MDPKNLFGRKKDDPAVNPQQTVQALQESNAAIQQAIKDVVEETRKSVKAAVDEAQEAVKQEAAKKEKQKKETPIMTAETEEQVKLRPETRPHAFVVMPFGKKKGGDGSLYDFNAIYKDLIKPALEAAGFEAFRADDATTSGDILTDMFQELLLADLAICDLSIDNANVYYELGIRHAFRKRGVVHIQAGRAYMPFDIFNVRTMPYHITAEGVPDPAFLEKDIQAIARMTRDTWASDRDAIHSPIFNLLTGLKEPARQDLRTPLATGFWREYNEWKDRVTIAQRQKRIGDILLLTEEISNPLIKEEAVGQAGKALANMGRNELALSQYRKGLEVNPQNLDFRRQEAFHLNRMGKVDDAIVRIEKILEDHPADSESIGYLGRIYKEMWTDSWKWIKDDQRRTKTAFDSYHWLIKAYYIYLKGFRANLNNTYPGVNALSLATILVDFADRFEDKADPDPEIAAIRAELPELRGTLEFGLEILAADEKADYWTLVSLADLHALTSDSIPQITRAYRKALTASRRNIFYLQSSIQQLEMFLSLGFREEYIKAAIKALKEELARINKEDYDQETPKGAEPAAKKKVEEGNVFVFSGYMIDKAREAEKNFSPDLEDEVRDAIRAMLEKLGAGPEDLAVTPGMSAGGDLLFIEACIERGVPVQTFMPLPEAAYVREFVSPAGEGWTERFYKARNHPLVDESYQSDHIGAVKPGDDLYERNNRWALYSALLRGMDKVRLIALWDDKSAKHTARDAHLARHMVHLMRDMGGQVESINPSKLKGAVEKKTEAPAEAKP
jgi:tetratricopeptide (TPR) repeat protein